MRNESYQRNNPLYTYRSVSALWYPTQTIKLWNKASEQREEAGEGRLIPAPHTEPNGYKYWSAEDTQKIIEYAGQSHKERYGNMKKEGK